MFIFCFATLEINNKITLPYVTPIHTNILYMTKSNSTQGLLLFEIQGKQIVSLILTYIIMKYFFTAMYSSKQKEHPRYKGWVPYISMNLSQVRERNLVTLR